MFIESLKIEGFRSFKSATWEPGALNVVIGENASGKSNLLRALRLLRENAKGRLEELVKTEGGFQDMVWDGSAVEASFQLLANQNAGKFEYYLVLIQDGSAGVWGISQEHLDEIINEHKRDPRFVRSRGDDDSKDNLPWVPCFDDHASTLYTCALDRLDFWHVRGFQQFLSGTSLHIDMVTEAKAEIRRPAITQFTDRLTDDGQNLVNVLHTLYTREPAFKEAVDDAMRVAFGSEFGELLFPPASDSRIEMRVRWKSLNKTTSMRNLSDGTIRFLMIIAALANPKPPSLIAIDEPELGLHPRMLPIVVEYAANAAMKTQVVFTTHSSDFLSAFRETTQPTVTVARLEDGGTTLTNIDGEELAKWLENFTLGELFQSGSLENLAS